MEMQGESPVLDSVPDSHLFFAGIGQEWEVPESDLASNRQQLDSDSETITAKMTGMKIM